jgi:hypothetical protein
MFSLPCFLKNGGQDMAVKIEAGRGEFSSFGGLKIFDQVISGCNLRRWIRGLMPTGKRITPQ